MVERFKIEKIERGRLHEAIDAASEKIFAATTVEEENAAYDELERALDGMAKRRKKEGKKIKEKKK